MTCFLRTRVTQDEVGGNVMVRIDGVDLPLLIARSCIAYCDPRPFQERDVVESTLTHRAAKSGVVIGVSDNSSKVWVKWDDDTETLEQSTQLKLYDTKLTRGISADDTPVLMKGFGK